MKKNFLMASLLCGLLAFGCINPASAHGSSVEDGIEMYRGYTFLGYLGSATVETSKDCVISVPAPAENVRDTAPSLPWHIDGKGQLVIAIRRYVLNIDPGEQVNIEVGVQMSNGEIGVYYITVTGA